MDPLALIEAVPGVGPALPYVLMGFGICAVVSAQLPPPRAPGSIYGRIYALVNLAGQNYRHATNVLAPVSAPKPPTT